ncbi:High-affinity glucose transporter [Fusarium oxysporum f. sp. albedinis]|nr:High-affinity glucose transporter [Fusarium oxysporum f. sp. albedinis]
MKLGSIIDILTFCHDKGRFSGDCQGSSPCQGTLEPPKPLLMRRSLAGFPLRHIRQSDLVVTMEVSIN